MSSEDVDRGTVLAEVTTAFERYEAALQENDVATLIALFWDDPRTIRASTDGLLVGSEEISAFRRGRPLQDFRRTPRRVEIAVLSNDVVIVALEWERSGTVGHQTQTWLRTPEGWRVAMGHVSTMR